MGSQLTPNTRSFLLNNGNIKYWDERLERITALMKEQRQYSNNSYQLIIASIDEQHQRLSRWFKVITVLLVLTLVITCWIAFPVSSNLDGVSSHKKCNEPKAIFDFVAFAVKKEYLCLC
jgi:hypothetical protein